jgi:hypothetical protein
VGKQLGEQLEDGLAIAGRIADEGRGAHPAASEIGDEGSDSLGIVTDDDDSDLVPGGAQPAPSARSGTTTRPY